MAKKNGCILIQDERIASLVNDACDLNRMSKEIEDKMLGIKTELEVLVPGKYKTPSGSMVTISEVPRYSDIEPSKAKRALIDNRMGPNFLKCVKVNITSIKRYLSDNELDSLREIVAYTRKHIFR